MAVPFDRNDVKDTPTSTEDSAERGIVKDREHRADPPSYTDLGKSELFDSDAEDIGDIADEGRGHRG